jgi:DNA polymerase III alpha subunit (gram-positive type)
MSSLEEKIKEQLEKVTERYYADLEKVNKIEKLTVEFYNSQLYAIQDTLSLSRTRFLKVMESVESEHEKHDVFILYNKLLKKYNEKKNAVESTLENKITEFTQQKAAIKENYDDTRAKLISGYSRFSSSNNLLQKLNPDSGIYADSSGFGTPGGGCATFFCL